jgi:hypothetical protein
LDEEKIPTQNFTVRCPRCQNLIRVQKGSTAQQLEATKAAPAVGDGMQDFSMKESEFQINNALRSLLSALQTEKKVLDTDETEDGKPRRILLCVGQKRDEVGKILVDAGFKVYAAQTPAQANERLREGKTEILIFSPDFAAEFGGAAILQQKVNAMYSAERRRLYLISLEEKGSTMNAHEAFLRNLNLVVNTSDIPQLPIILNRALRDFNDLYHYFNRALQLDPI